MELGITGAIIVILAIVIIGMFIRNLIKSETQYKTGTIHKKYTTTAYSSRYDSANKYFFFDVFYTVDNSTKVKKMEVDYNTYNKFELNDKILVK